MHWRDFWRFIWISTMLTVLDLAWAYLTGDRPNHRNTVIITAMAVIVSAIREERLPAGIEGRG